MSGKGLTRNEKCEYVQATPAFFEPTKVAVGRYDFQDYMQFVFRGDMLDSTTAFPMCENQHDPKAKIMLYITEFINQMIYKFPNGSPMLNTQQNKTACGPSHTLVDKNAFIVPLIPKINEGQEQQQGDEEPPGDDTFSDAGQQTTRKRKKPAGNAKKICGYVFEEPFVGSNEEIKWFHSEKVKVVFEFIFKKVPEKTDLLTEAFKFENVAAVLVTLTSRDPNYHFNIACHNQICKNMQDIDTGTFISEPLLKGLRSSAMNRGGAPSSSSSQQAGGTLSGTALGVDSESMRLAFKNPDWFNWNFAIEYLQMLGMDPLEIFEDELQDLDNLGNFNPLLASVLARYAMSKGKDVQYIPSDVMHAYPDHFRIDRIFKSNDFLKHTLLALGADPLYGQHTFVKDIHNTDPMLGEWANDHRYTPLRDFSCYLTSGLQMLRTSYFHNKIINEDTENMPRVSDIYQFGARDLLKSMGTCTDMVSNTGDGALISEFQPFEQLAWKRSHDVSTVTKKFTEAKSYAELCHATQAYSSLYNRMQQIYQMQSQDPKACQSLKSALSFIRQRSTREKKPMLTAGLEFKDLLPASQWLAEFSVLMNLMSKAVDTNHYIYEYYMALNGLFFLSRNLRRDGIGINTILEGGPGTGKSYAELVMEVLALFGSFERVDAASSRAFQSFVGDFLMVIFPDAGTQFMRGEDPNAAANPDFPQTRQNIQSVMSEAQLTTIKAHAGELGVTGVKTNVRLRANFVFNTNFVNPRKKTQSDAFHNRIDHIPTGLNSMMSNFGLRTKKNSDILNDADKQNIKKIYHSLTSYQALAAVFISFSLESELIMRPSRAQAESYLDRLMLNARLSLPPRNRAIQINKGDVLHTMGALRTTFASPHLSPFQWELYESIDDNNSSNKRIKVTDSYETFEMDHFIFAEPMMASSTSAAVQTVIGGFGHEFSLALKVMKIVGETVGFNAQRIRQCVHIADKTKHILCTQAINLPTIIEKLETVGGIHDLLVPYAASREIPMSESALLANQIQILENNPSLVVPIIHMDTTTGQGKDIANFRRLDNIVRSLNDVYVKVASELTQFTEARKNLEDGESGMDSTIHMSDIENNRIKTRAQSSSTTKVPTQWQDGYRTAIEDVERFQRETVKIYSSFWITGNNQATFKRHKEAALATLNMNFGELQCEDFKRHVSSLHKLMVDMRMHATTKVYVELGERKYTIDGVMSHGSETTPELPSNNSRDPTKRRSKKRGNTRNNNKARDFMMDAVMAYMTTDAEGDGEQQTKKGKSSNKKQNKDVLNKEQQELANENPLEYTFPFGSPWTGYSGKINLNPNMEFPLFPKMNSGGIRFNVTDKGFLDLNYVVFGEGKSLEDVIIAKTLERTNGDTPQPMLPMEVSNIIDFCSKNSLYGPCLPFITVDEELTPYRIGCMFNPLHLEQCDGAWIPIIKKIDSKNSEQQQQQDHDSSSPPQPILGGGGVAPAAKPNSKILISTYFLMHNQKDLMHYLIKQAAPQINNEDTHVLALPSLQNLSVFVDVQMPPGRPAKNIDNIRYVEPWLQKRLSARGFLFEKEHSIRVLQNSGKTTDETRLLANKAFALMGYPADSITDEQLMNINHHFSELDARAGSGTLQYPQSMLGSMNHYVKMDYQS